VRALIQRVSRASVTAGAQRADIGPGLLILLGVKRGDTPEAADWLARKCAGLRIFEDDAGRMNRSLLDTGGDALVVSQFTLYGDADRGRRPSFTLAAAPGEAIPLYERFVSTLRSEGVRNVGTGVFQAMMTVELVNDGPVTLLVESRGEAAVGRTLFVDTGAEPLVLASASPRRSDLLRQAGIPHVVSPTTTDETLRPGASPREEAERLAREKAAAARPAWPGRRVLAADTIVDLDGESLGKPVDARDAARMLERLSGRTHEVHTGLALVAPGTGTIVSAVETTRVVFRELDAAEIQAYIESDEPFDKAGAYGIQGLGALLVERVDGSYDNIVGLPLARLVALLKSAGRSEP
jgi:MAF protein/D-tyrosyl-tRNA(Tyr) deacylase